MKIRHEEEKLKKISDRILVDSYCSVEPVNEEMEKVCGFLIIMQIHLESF